MQRGGNVGWSATPKGDSFMRFTLVTTACLTNIALTLITGTPPPKTCTLVPEGSWGFSRNRAKPPKPRSEASCRGLHDTGVELSQYRERSPRGARQHPAVFMPSTHMGRCGWWPRKSSLLLGPIKRPKIIENRSSWTKRHEELPFKEISMRNTSAGGWKLLYTVKGPGCNLPEVKPKPLSWESVVLTHHCRGSVLLTYLQKEQVWTPSLWSRWTPSVVEGIVLML
jgi:hypothetical protein